MKNLTPLRLSVITSVLIALAFAIIYIPASIIIEGDTQWRVFFIVATCLLIISFLMQRLILEKFIYNRIRLIYKTIHNLKASKKQEKAFLLGSKDILGQANQEVLEWATDRAREIDDLKKLEAYRREFLGNVSHELKTPVFNIQGYVLTLLDGGLDDPEINRKYLQRTEQSVNRMISIIEDLESIARLESGELKMDYAHFDMCLLAREVMEFMEIKAEKKNIRLYFGQQYDSPVMVYADRERIQQVLTNLMVNAIKYGTENGRTKISFFDMDDRILVEVTDSGIGIPRDELPRIFERFYRGDKSRSRQLGDGGSGLGLAIVKHIIEAHNQTINVRSTPGVGTTFAFTLSKGKGSGAPKRYIPVF